MSQLSSPLLSQLSARPQHVFLEFGDRQWSGSELLRAAHGMASVLAEQGVRAGDRVAILADAAPEVVFALLATVELGASYVPINTRYRRAEVEHILRDAAPRIVLVDALGKRGEVLRGFDAARVLDLSAQAEAGDGTVERHEPAAHAFPHTPAPRPGFPRLIIYTSGTTGPSKGVELSEASVVANIGALTELWEWSERDRLSLALPLFHVHGLCIGVIGALLRGTTMILHPRFEVEAVLKDFRSRAATVFMGVPTMYRRLLDHFDAHPEDADALRGARLFTSGSAALPAHDHEAWRAHTGHAILERYGMTETLLTFSNPLHGERRPGTVGRPVPGCKARIVDDEGDPVTAGAVGELWVQSNGAMTRYRSLPEQTAASHHGPWFKTGDVAVEGPEGYVRIVGRRSVDIIKSGGFKISAREIEEVLLTHPAVQEVAVVGIPDPTWGERITAVLVSSARETSPLREELAALATEALADFKKPRRFEFVDQLPRNALGKLQKRELIQRFSDPSTDRGSSGA